MSFMKKMRKGFTLIELMIVVAIIGVLAAIAIPNFLKFQCKSKTSEAKNMLKGIYTANVAYSGETECFSAEIQLFGLDLADVTPTGASGAGKYYTFTVINNNSTGFQATGHPTNPIHGTWNIGYFGPNNSNNGMVRNITTYCP
jgi:prepilin-type N-terminal cleavage/methylation domain-containing protein